MTQRISIKVQVESPELQTLTVLQHGTETTYNMVQLLKFRENLIESMADHATQQSYWEQCAIDLEFKRMEFEESGYAIWWAHARRYARYYQKAIGAKETLESLKDAVVSLYSATVPPEERELLVKEAFKGFLLEKHGTEKKINEHYESSVVPYTTDLEKFQTDALMFVAEGWSYESIEKVKRDLMEAAKRMASFARTHNERAFKMGEVAAHDLPKYGNVSTIQPNQKQMAAVTPSSQPVSQSLPPVKLEEANSNAVPMQTKSRRVMNMPKETVSK